MIKFKVLNSELTNENFIDYFTVKLFDYFSTLHKVELIPSLIKFISFNPKFVVVSGDGDFITEYMSGKFVLKNYILLVKENRSVKVYVEIAYSNFTMYLEFELCLFYEKEIEFIQNSKIETIIENNEYLIDIEVFNLDFDFHKYECKFDFHDDIDKLKINHIQNVYKYDKLGFEVVSLYNDKVIELKFKDYIFDTKFIIITYKIENESEIKQDLLEGICTQVLNSFKKKIILNKIEIIAEKSTFELKFDILKEELTLRKNFFLAINKKIGKAYKLNEIVYR
ncbi:MAG: hypothetical protein RLZZ546_1593 [Bacteroidota bacterium]|jgi:hypothetical protein